jgi:hypothetical protein
MTGFVWTAAAASGAGGVHFGESADTKPTTDVPEGAIFYEFDTGAAYIYDGAAWHLYGASALYRSSKTATFTGAAGLGAVGAVDIFTVTGSVEIVRLVPQCTVLLTEAAPTGATIKLGVTGSTALFIAATNAIDIDAAEYWFSTTPVVGGDAIPDALKHVAITADVIATVAVAAVDGGAVRFDAIWRPLSSGGLVVAA